MPDEGPVRRGRSVFDRSEAGGRSTVPNLDKERVTDYIGHPFAVFGREDGAAGGGAKEAMNTRGETDGKTDPQSP